MTACLTFVLQFGKDGILHCDVYINVWHIQRNLHDGRHCSEQFGLSEWMSSCHCLVVHLKRLIVLPKQGLVKIGLKLIRTSGEYQFPHCSSEQYGVAIFISISHDLVMYFMSL